MNIQVKKAGRLEKHDYLKTSDEGDLVRINTVVRTMTGMIYCRMLNATWEVFQSPYTDVTIYNPK